MQADEKDMLLSLVASDLNIVSESDRPENEEQLLSLIAQRVEELLHSDIDLLMSYLYRLDIDEKRINFVINQQFTVPPQLGLAQLILDRQKERVESKRSYKQERIEGWDTW